MSRRRFATRASKIEDDGYEDRMLAHQQSTWSEAIMIAGGKSHMAPSRRPTQRENRESGSDAGRLHESQLGRG